MNSDIQNSDVQNSDVQKLEKIIGYTFQNPELAQRALRHSSFANEHKKEGMINNERLEFLGDAVLELVSSTFIYQTFPDMPEGEMTRLRASLVCEPTLATCARAFGLPEWIRLGKGEEHTGGRERDSIISDALEALIGAVYLDGGLTAARELILRFILDDIEHKKKFHDSKTILQEMIQHSFRGVGMRYEPVSETGPDHARRFEVRVRLGDRVFPSGSGSTKKAAEQEAAYHAILELEQS